MNPVLDAFSPSYAQARAKFLAACASAGLSVNAHLHPLAGRDGEVLALDVALDGSPDADKLLILSSACHGAEGFCGSGVQVAALHDAAWRAKARAHGVAVLYLHALNPYGFSHLRRTTHENVDLNRNFQDFSAVLPVNQAYAAIHHLLLPRQWPADADNQAAIAQLIESQGMDAFQAAVTRGQHAFPGGLFYGGVAPSWSNLTLRQVLRDQAGQARHIAWIDLHTGLGPSGLGERIFACKNDPAAMARASRWWGGDGATPVTSIYDGSSSSQVLTGLMWLALYEECPQARYTGIAMEYGTLPRAEVTEALRAEHWLHQHPQAAPELARQIKQQLKDAFYTDTDEWKVQVVAQARQALFQAVDGLSERRAVEPTATCAQA